MNNSQFKQLNISSTVAVGLYPSSYGVRTFCKMFSTLATCIMANRTRLYYFHSAHNTFSK